MDVKRISDTLTEVTGPGGTVRIEKGPARFREKATEALLSDDVTAEHYFAGKRKERIGVTDPRTRKPRVGPDGKPVMREVEKIGVDAMGKPIKVGETHDFIDWKGTRPPVFTVYRLEDVPHRKIKGKTVPRFMPKGAHADPDAAMSQAVTLAAGQ